MNPASKYLLPYQIAWIQDDAPRKLADKSRRVGWTYAEAYDAVSRRFRETDRRDCDYWFSSADESAAREFIEYCQFFARDLFGRIADIATIGIEDPDTGRVGNAFVIRCPNGTKITGMTSNPRRFRSKGGDVCLDEFAFHDEAEAMLNAANPVTTWGGSLRIFSTPNGEGTTYNRLAQNCRKVLRHLGYDPDDAPAVPFEHLTRAADELGVRPVCSYHHVTIVDAIEQGLVEKINEATGTEWTRESFLADCRSKSLDDDAYLQEYMCVPAAGAKSWLTYAMIERCEDDACVGTDTDLVGYTGEICTVGVDVGRQRDLTVVWVLEWVGDIGWTRRILRIEKTPLPHQQLMIEALLEQLRWSRCLIDKTGIGLGLYEYLRHKLGSRVEGVDFTNPNKQAIGVDMKQAFEDRSVRIPTDQHLRETLHKVRKTVTSTGLVRLDAPRDSSGHADEFWALGNAIHANAIRGEAVMMVGGPKDVPFKAEIVEQPERPRAEAVPYPALRGDA